MNGDLLDRFADEVGPEDAGPVVAVGGGTHAEVGGQVLPGTRPVHAPAGLVEHRPEEMTVRVRAGTTVVELDAALGASGQCVALPDHEGRTVGGVLAVGHSGVRRLGWGPVRDTVLEARFVTAQGRMAVTGGPTVKNVTGYDLCRLLVGSLGTLGLLAELVLRTRPLPRDERWFAAEVDPFRLLRRLHRPTALLWDGTTAWALLAGHPADVSAQAAAGGLAEVAAPPALPPHRWSLPPQRLPGLPDDGEGRFIAEVGVGIVHRDRPQPARPLAPTVAALQQRIKDELDPGNRLAPGRTPGIP